ncbi:MAG: DUF4296 domain-containing protein [Bacteroidales bacterium]|nr:DUF4296 domain-containing protein [Bacteroidales bacterium]
MRKIYAIPIAMGLILAASCGATIKPPMPEDKCAHLIFEMHKTDAMLKTLNYQDVNLHNDSLSYYNSLFAKEGVTRKQYLETIDWYIKHPEQYKDLYTKVIKLVSKYEQEERARYELSENRDTNDVWDMKTNWNLPLDGDKNPIAFNIPIRSAGIYTLEADITYYADDGSQDPHTTMIVEYDDGTTSENTVYEAVKDGKQRHVEVMVSAEKGKTVKCLRGWVLDHSSDTQNKHIDCYNIKILRTFEEE